MRQSRAFLADVRFMEDAYGIELSGGQSMTLIYGMSAANVESYAEKFFMKIREAGDMVIWYSGLSRSVNCMMLLLAVAAALLPTLLEGRKNIRKDFPRTI